MPSQLHEALLTLFSNNLELAPTLLKLALGSDLPEYRRIQLHSGELTRAQPLELRADLLAVLYGAADLPVLSVVIEVQLNPDAAKRFAWPAYGTEARSRYRCPAIVLVVTPRQSVARWASEPIALGGGNLFTPLVIGPKGIPYVTELEEARSAPELSVLSAMAHGREENSEQTLRVAMVALAASAGLDRERALLYYDLVHASLSEAVKKELLAMDPATYEYQSDFAKHYVAKGVVQGREEGVAQGLEEGVAQGLEQGIVRGEARLLLKMLTRRFGPLPEEMVARIGGCDVATIEQLADRFVTAESLNDLFK